MLISRVRAYDLRGVPITPPPFREVPTSFDAVVLVVDTDDGLRGCAMAGTSHPVLTDFVNKYLAPALLGEDPLRVEHLRRMLADPRPEAKFGEHRLGRVFTGALSALDIALWDIKAKALGLPLHRLLGGARDRVEVYITHGAAYGGAQPYSVDELVAEAKYLVDAGNTHLKITVGRQLVDNEFAPDPHDDAVRLRAVREAVGPKVRLAMDGNSRMTVPQATTLCLLAEDLDISFFEEPVIDNDPRMLAAVRARTTIPIAAAESPRYRARDYLVADAVDIMQPNVVNDGGYSGAMQVAAIARAFNKRLGQGNGGGPFNIALNAGIANGGGVEYHMHNWMAYTAIFEGVPHPENGFVAAADRPGHGLEIRDGMLDEHRA